MAEPTRFSIIGSGWRTKFMLRIAAASGGKLVPVGVMVRNPEKRADIEAYGVHIQRAQT